MQGVLAVARAKAKFKANAKGGPVGWIKRTNNAAEIDGTVSPLAAAISRQESERVQELLAASGLEQVLGVEISRTHGEQYTGGASCPVFKLRCIMRDRELHLVAKVVIVNEKTEERQAMKCRSYRVEALFYQATSTFLASARAAIPRLYASEMPPHGGNVFTLVMSDLSHPFPAHPQELSLASVHAALRWLARLHATFWGLEAGVVRGLWEAGAHWTLDKDGQASLLDIGPRWGDSVKYLKRKEPKLAERPSLLALGTRLQAAAVPLDTCLRGDRPEADGAAPPQRNKEQRRFRTIIHGDAKAANMFFTSEGPAEAGGSIEAAVCDFQYAGEGFGAMDLAYLLFPDARSCFLGSEKALLDFYHDALSEVLGFRGAMYTREHLGLHFRLATLDYFRHHVARSGFVACSSQDVQLVCAMDDALAWLDGGKVRAPAQYAAAIAKELAKVS